MRALFLFIFLLPLALQAQKINISGKLLDENKAGLPSATVMLLQPSDSSLLAFTTTNTEGKFEFKNQPNKNYLFRVTYVGYQTLYKAVGPSDGSASIELGEIALQVKSTQLNEVVVKAERAPVIIKKDTIEFDAPSFKTQENANVEDLLKKLPGVEVDSDGDIRAQGENVQRVMVDGREFFGRDPKLATKNLPAKAIDKVQIFDKQSDQATFTGIDDGQREKTINLKLKEEFKNGIFGSANAGYGTDERYVGKLSLFRFKKTEQLSVLGMSNNTNEQGFGIDDYLNFSGQSGQLLGGGGGGLRLAFNAGGSQGGPSLNFGGRQNGIIQSLGTGVNFNKDFSPKSKLSSNYFFNWINHRTDQTLNRDNFFSSGLPSNTFNQNAFTDNSNYNHRIEANLDQQIDSVNSVKWSNSLTRNETESLAKSVSDTKNAEGVIVNEGTTQTKASQVSDSYTTSALLRHKFKKKGRSISSNVSFGFSKTEYDGRLEATNTFYLPQNNVINTNQRSEQETETMNYGVTLSYTEPLGNRKYLEAGYVYTRNQSDVNREVYDLVNEGENFNDALSTTFESDYQVNRPLMNVKINRDKYSLTMGTGYQFTQLKGNFISEGGKLNRTFQNWVPSVRFNYKFTNTKNINIDYDAQVQEPNISQLQPVVDNSDPLNISEGNPNLIPAVAHTLRANFITFSPVSFVNFFLLGSAIYTENAITTAQTFSEGGIRTTRPINVRGNTVINANFSVGFPVKKLLSRFNISANVLEQFGLNVINNEETDIRTHAIGGSVRYNFSYKEFINVDLSATTSRNQSEYEFNEQANQLFFNNNYEARATFNFAKLYMFSANYELLDYRASGNDFTQQVNLLNFAFSRFILKNKAGEIKIGVNNVLNNNFGASQNASFNFVERTTYNNLGRYWMVSFTYNLNKQLNPMGQRGGMRMMFRQ
ncbi:MAG: outer membrane beta-barrel family protein [Cyclobacteriaceae bacterium]|nr:outer membrane beta-barrel family protein [Cytophagales bacterium]MCZ8327489.1 outer membrane beta-barrel family protein [Cyclobacteriaceae bacterium]